MPPRKPKSLHGPRIPKSKMSLNFNSSEDRKSPGESAINFVSLPVLDLTLLLTSQLLYLQAEGELARLLTSYPSGHSSSLLVVDSEMICVSNFLSRSAEDQMLASIKAQVGTLVVEGKVGQFCYIQLIKLLFASDLPTHRERY